MTTLANNADLNKFGIAPNFREFLGSRLKKSHYRALVNWLTKHKQKSDSSDLERVRGYIEALHHLCSLQYWEPILNILEFTIPINPPNVNWEITLIEYLLFRQFYKEILAISRETLKNIDNKKYDISYIKLLKARALLGIDGKSEEALHLFEEVHEQADKNIEISVEALTHLGINQVYSGIYSEGVEKISSLIINIDLIDRYQANFKLQSLKTDILEAIAFYEMNSSHFQRAIQLYQQLSDMRNQLGIYHKLISPAVHQGILLRKSNQYNQAIKSLQEAYLRASELNSHDLKFWIEHHLAYVNLNKGNINEANTLCNRSLKGYQKLDNLQGVSDCYEQMGLIDLAKDEFNTAEINFRKSLRIRRSIKNLHGKASSVLDLALVKWHKRDFLKAAYYLAYGFYLYYQLRILNFTRIYRMLKLSFTWTIGKRKWTM